MVPNFIIDISETLRKCFPVKFTALPRNVIAAVSQTAEMVIGGTVVCSACEQNGDREIFAQTVVQLDGDIITAFREDVVKGSNFEMLSRRHFEEVASALALLSKLSVWIGCLPLLVVSSGMTVQLLNVIRNGVDAFASDAFYVIVIIALISLFTRKIFVWVVRRQADRLMKRARKEIREYAKKKLEAREKA